MHSRRAARWSAALSVSALAAASFAAPSLASTNSGSPARFLVLAQGPVDYAGLRAQALDSGAAIVTDLPEISAFIARGSAAARAALDRDARVAGTSADTVVSVDVAERAKPALSTPALQRAKIVSVEAPGSPAAAAARTVAADPAYSYRGLLWDYPRIGAPQAWTTTRGDGMTVAVSDTGIDFTHPELASRVTKVYDFTDGADNTCKRLYGASDRDLHNRYGGPVATDWNGHGSWIAGNIGGALDGKGINGIAPRVKLVAHKIAQWCGSTSDLTILNSYVQAGRDRIDVVNNSFGGYSDLRDPDQRTVYNAYRRAVAYANGRGTMIVASAGNDALRVGAGGKVLSHGPLTTPGTKKQDFFDYYGRYQTPGGVPGVVDVSSTNRITVPSSANCLPGTTGDYPDDVNATCKPTSDRHQAAGQGKQDQLAYYSNYGPRIDLAGQGGARKFNLPNYDRGGTPGFPYTGSDLTNVYEDFSVTSNWALEIPCFTFTKGSGFYTNACYSAIQGTSMAAPHVAAAAALSAAAHPNLRHNTHALLRHLKGNARDDATNDTRALSRTDKSPGDLSELACPTGYCHLSGARIPDRDAYGAGIVYAGRP